MIKKILSLKECQKLSEKELDDYFVKFLSFSTKYSHAIAMLIEKRDNGETK